MSMAEFFTADEANEGEKLPLYTPDGVATSHYITVRGVDSDAYRLAHTRIMRRTRFADIETDDARDKLTLDAMTELAAALISGWSFDEEFSTEAALAFLKKAPQFVSPINELAGNRSLFFGLKRSASVASQNQNSSSDQS